MFTVDGTSTELPERAADVLALRPEASPRLNVSVGAVGLACHFFAADEIECDPVPQEVDGPERPRAVLTFLGELARATQKPAVLTPENMPKAPYFRAEPATGALDYLAASRSAI